MDKLDIIDFVCISLDTRKDRRRKVKQVFKRIGILDRITWWIVSKNPYGGVYGCFESHLMIWKKFGSRPYLCVFEDDLDGYLIDFIRLMTLLPHIRTPVINLAPSPVYVSEVINGVSYGNFLDTVAYILQRRDISQIIKHVEPYYGIPIDLAMIDIPTAGISIFRQINQDSDVSERSYYYYYWRKRVREVLTSYIPGFGSICLNGIISSRSNPAMWNSEIGPVQLVDRRVNLKGEEKSRN